MAAATWSGSHGGNAPNDYNCDLTYDDVTFQLLAVVYWNATSRPVTAVVIDPTTTKHIFTLASGSGSSGNPITDDLTGLGLTMQHQAVTGKYGPFTAVSLPAGWQAYFQYG